MGKIDDIVVRNLHENRMICADIAFKKMWNDVAKLLSGSEEDKYEKSKEAILDTGAEIMAYFGEVAQELDKFIKEKLDN